MEKVLHFAERLEAGYPEFVEKSIQTRRFRHKHIIGLIEDLKSGSDFEIKLAGNSTEGREIYLLKAGAGKTKVFLWSQMHGDEPTGTAAMFDIFNFLKQSGQFDNEKAQILNNLELHFLPLVNPDGAELYKRRNILDIDLNRDAARLEAVETQLLKNLHHQILPEYGFNLHDQETYYTAGLSKYPATISFLAPSFNKEKTIDEKRQKSIHQIVLMNTVLQRLIPNCIGRYNDDFMPTAFGDNMQLWGTSTILIESGGYYNDPEKQVARKMNVISILSSLYSIANQTVISNAVNDYFQIPENKKDKLFDLLIRNASIERNGKKFRIDIGVRNTEENTADFSGFENRAKIFEIGDLSYFYGYKEIDADQLVIRNLNNGPMNNLLIGYPADFCLSAGKDLIIYKIKNGALIE